MSEWYLVGGVVFVCVCYLIAHIFQTMKVRIKYRHWIPRQLLVDAITLYPWILFSGSKSDGRVQAVAIRHEFIHVRQVIEKGWLLFYGTYILSWLWNSIRKIFGGLKGKTAYDVIPYEVEAYARQDEPLSAEARRIYEDSE